MPSVKAKFSTDNKGNPIRCPRNERSLRNLPECGILFYQDRPFVPHSGPPHPPPPPPPPHHSQPYQKPIDYFPEQLDSLPTEPSSTIPQQPLPPEQTLEDESQYVGDILNQQSSFAITNLPQDTQYLNHRRGLLTDDIIARQQGLPTDLARLRGGLTRTLNRHQYRPTESDPLNSYRAGTESIAPLGATNTPDFNIPQPAPDARINQITDTELIDIQIQNLEMGTDPLPPIEPMTPRRMIKINDLPVGMGREVRLRLGINDANITSLPADKIRSVLDQIDNEINNSPKDLANEPQRIVDAIDEARRLNVLTPAQERAIEEGIRRETRLQREVSKELVKARRLLDRKSKAPIPPSRPEFDPTEPLLPSGEGTSTGVEFNPFETEQQKIQAIKRHINNKYRRRSGVRELTTKEMKETLKFFQNQGRDLTESELVDILENKIKPSAFNQEFENMIKGIEDPEERSLERRIRQERLVDERRQEIQAFDIEEGQTEGFRFGRNRNYARVQVDPIEDLEGLIRGAGAANVRLSGSDLSSRIRMTKARLGNSISEGIRIANQRTGEGITAVDNLRRSLQEQGSRFIENQRISMSNNLNESYRTLLQNTNRNLTQAELDNIAEALRNLPPEQRGLYTEIPRSEFGIDPVDLELGAETDELLRETQDIDIGRDVDDTIERNIGRRPKLSFRERVAVAKSSSILGETTEARVATGGGPHGGLLSAYGVSALLNVAGSTNPYVNAGLASGAADSGARFSAMIANNLYQRIAQTGVETGVEVGEATAQSIAQRLGTQAVKSGIRSGIGGFFEGAGIGLALTPLDMYLNDAVFKSSGSHETANLVSGATTGAVATALIGGIALASAPETLGLSLLAGVIGIGISEAVGGYMGYKEDQDLLNASRDANENNNIRILFVKNFLGENVALPGTGRFAKDYDIDRSLERMRAENPRGYEMLTNGVGYDEWIASLRTAFGGNPQASKRQLDSNEQTAEQQQVNNLFTKYVIFRTIQETCKNSAGDSCQSLVQNHDPTKGRGLTKDEMDILDKATNNTWLDHAELQVFQSMAEMTHRNQEATNARNRVLDAWDSDRTYISELDPTTQRLARQDEAFMATYRNATKTMAQQEVVNAYMRNQTKYSDVAPRIRNIAFGIQDGGGTPDADFQHFLNTFYYEYEHGAAGLGISVAQLIELQSLPEDEQKTRYANFQFDIAKEDPSVVADAQKLSATQQRVREATFYDLDQAFLDQADPTTIGTWKPSDSQILQANQYGMPLSEYVVYIRELSKGNEGDYTKIPNYTGDDRNRLIQIDFQHFESELAMAQDLGADVNPGDWDLTPDGRIIRKNGNGSIPLLNHHRFLIDDFEPSALTQSRQEYANMIHGLNQQNQAQVDEYNAGVMRQLSVFQNNYDEMVAGQNAYIARHAIRDTPLLAFDTQGFIDQYTIQYNPLDDQIPRGNQKASGGTLNMVGNNGHGSVMDAKLQAEIEGARRRGLTRQQYIQSKRILTDQVNELGIDGPTQQMILNAETQVKTGNTRTTEGDTITIRDSNNKIIRQTKAGKDITDTLQEEEVSNFIPEKTDNNEKNTNLSNTSNNKT